MSPQPVSKPAPRPTSAPEPAATLSQRVARWAKKEPARVFTPADSLELGTPHEVGMALSRMVRAGTLRRVARGLYDVPRTSYTPQGPDALFTSAQVDELFGVLDHIKATARAA